MRKLSDTQQERIMRAMSAIVPKPYLNLDDLDDLRLDGWFHLNHLRLLVAMLTACGQELLAEHEAKP